MYALTTFPHYSPHQNAVSQEERNAAKEAQDAAEAEAAAWAAPPPPPPAAAAGKKGSKKKKRSSKKKAELDSTGEGSGTGRGDDGHGAEAAMKEAVVPEIGLQPVEREIRCPPDVRFALDIGLSCCHVGFTASWDISCSFLN